MTDSAMAGFGGTIWWAGLALMGLVVGVVAGMFGIGGGFLLVPLLNIVFGVPWEIATGTGLCQMIGTAVAAYRRHRRLRQGEPKIDWIMLGGAVVGVQAGARLVEALAQRGAVLVWGHPIPAVKLCLSLVYVVILTLVAAWMIHDSRTRPANMPLRIGPLARFRFGPLTRLPRIDRHVSVLLMAYLGLGLGLLSGLMGLGGGILLMPILIYGIGMRARMAAGTGIILLVATSLVGTLSHALLDNVRLGIAFTLMAGSTLGAPIGANITHRTRGDRLRGLFGSLVLITVAAIVFDLARILLTPVR